MHTHIYIYTYMYISIWSCICIWYVILYPPVRKNCSECCSVIFQFAMLVCHRVAEFWGEPPKTIDTSTPIRNRHKSTFHFFGVYGLLILCIWTSWIRGLILPSEIRGAACPWKVWSCGTMRSRQVQLGRYQAQVNCCLPWDLWILKNFFKMFLLSSSLLLLLLLLLCCCCSMRSSENCEACSFYTLPWVYIRWMKSLARRVLQLYVKLQLPALLWGEAEGKWLVNGW